MPGSSPTTLYVPPGWPAAVRPPGAPDWERTAVAYLFDCCPADFRQYAVLKRHPIVLARFATESVAAQVRACGAGLSHCRAGLADLVPPDALEAATLAWHEQGAALRRTAREVALVEDALRGRVFVAKL